MPSVRAPFLVSLDTACHHKFGITTMKFLPCSLQIGVLHLGSSLACCTMQVWVSFHRGRLPFVSSHSLTVSASAFISASPPPHYHHDLVPSASCSLPLVSASCSLPLVSASCSLPLVSASCSLHLVSASCSLPLVSASCSLTLVSASCSLTLVSASCSLPLVSASCSLPLVHSLAHYPHRPTNVHCHLILGSPCLSLPAPPRHLFLTLCYPTPSPSQVLLSFFLLSMWISISVVTVLLVSLYLHFTNELLPIFSSFTAQVLPCAT